MIKITKEQRDYLESNGCKFPQELHHTVGNGKKKTYYATECKKVFSLLKNR